MSGATPEELSRAENIVKAVQERATKQDAQSASADTRRDRVEQTMGVDARKTRDLIRQNHYVSLPVLARDLAPRITDLPERHKLEQALDEFLSANAEYRRTEELPPAVIDWIGGPNGRIDMPSGAPDHKRNLADAWHLLLKCVNELSKVGIVKPQKLLFSQDPTAIELLADLDEGQPLVAPHRWD